MSWGVSCDLDGRIPLTEVFVEPLDGVRPSSESGRSRRMTIACGVSMGHALERCLTGREVIGFTGRSIGFRWASCSASMTTSASGAFHLVGEPLKWPIQARGLLRL